MATPPIRVRLRQTLSCTPHEYLMSGSGHPQVRKAFNLDHGALTGLAEKVAPGSEGVNFLPYLTGQPGSQQCLACCNACA